MGTGFSFSRLRPQNAIVKSTGGVSSGPLSFLKVFDAATNTVSQGGKRRGANMGVLRVDHPDILDFIKAKTELNEENQKIFEASGGSESLKNRLLETQFKNFNLSVAITDEFIEAVFSDSDYALVEPHTGEVVETIYAPDVWNFIVKSAWKNGEPGMIFIDTINEEHPLEEMVESTNPCGEQPLLPNESCNLGSINLSNFYLEESNNINFKDLKETVQLAVRFLDNVITINEYPLPQIEEITKTYRKIGLGVMGFHELIIKMGIPYDTWDAVQLAESIMQIINDTAHKTSEEIGANKGYSWNGKRNATLTTIAPTGSISKLAGTSGGIEPFFDLSYTHTDGEGNVSKYDYDYDAKTATEIDPIWHLRIQAAFQKHVDNAVSKTINLPNEATAEEVGAIYLEAYKLGCKGITVYRDGSRENQVLESSEEDRGEPPIKQLLEKGEPTEDLPYSRPKTTSGDTTCYQTGCGKMYCTINVDEYGKPFETFLTTGSNGGCRKMTEAVSRLTSMALRSPIPIDVIIDQLNSVSTCPSFMYQKGKGKNIVGKSCANIVAMALKEQNEVYINEKDIRKINGIQIGGIEFDFDGMLSTDFKNICPECGSNLRFAEGCTSCVNTGCGYSEC